MMIDMILKYKIKKQQIIKIKRKEENPIQHSINYLKLAFIFKDEDWTDLIKFIQFKFKGETYQYYLDDIDEEGFYNITVPSFILEGKGFHFTIYGTDNQVRITTETIEINIIENDYTKNISPINPDEDPEDITTKIFKILETKVDKVDGKELSTNDFTDVLLNKLNNVEDYATHNIIDNVISPDSENAVQNKIINGELVKKMEDSDLNLMLIALTDRINSL